MGCDPNNKRSCSCVAPCVSKNKNSVGQWTVSLLTFGVMVYILWGFTQVSAEENVEAGREGDVVITETTTENAENNSVTTAPVGEVGITNLPVFSPEELKTHDGVQESTIYVGYEGLIYDMTASPSFAAGKHYGHLAGQDLTQAMAAAPHGAEIFEGFPVVGQLAGDDITQIKKIRQPIKIFGFTLPRFTAYLALVFFILNFATCVAMPWSKLFMPWKGKLPGKDEWDEKGHLRLTAIHRPFAWGFLIFGIAHTILAILQNVFNITI